MIDILERWDCSGAPGWLKRLSRQASILPPGQRGKGTRASSNHTWLERNIAHR